MITATFQSQTVEVTVERVHDGFTAYIPGCHVQAPSIEEALELLRGEIEAVLGADASTITFDTVVAGAEEPLA